ncbi:hypothetical protein [Thermococcus sp.]
MFFGGGFVILVSFLVVGMLSSVPPVADGLTVVLSLLVILPISKHLFAAMGLDEDSSRKLAVLTGIASVVVFYLTIPRACGGCHL